MYIWRVGQHGMEAGYMCSRCIRALRPGVSRRLASSLTPRRNFSSTIPKNNSKPRSTLVPQTLRRNASAATAPREPDNFERHNQAPNDYAEYMSQPRRVLRELYHPFSKSPVPEIRQRAAFTRQHAYCPHPSHQQTRLPVSPHDPEARKTPTSTIPPAHVHFECPDCGIPVYCSEEHWADDYESHLEICETLRQINEDDHDLRSGRWFPEFEYPGPQIDEILVNMTSWDTFLYTRGFEAINDERSMRQATRLLTYPLTLGSILHELSPYNIRTGGRLTSEGLKSLSGE